VDASKLERVPSPAMDVSAVVGYGVEGTLHIEWLGRAGAIVSDTGCASLATSDHYFYFSYGAHQNTHDGTIVTQTALSVTDKDGVQDLGRPTATECAVIRLTVQRTLEMYWTPAIQRRAEYAHAVQQLITWRDDPTSDTSPEYRALMEADYDRGPEGV